MKKILNRIVGIVIIIVGMSGYRIDRFSNSNHFKYLTFLLIWGIGIVLSVISAIIIAPNFNLTGILIYSGAAWMFYYLGNSAILISRLRKQMKTYFGEETAFRIYEVIVGLMFLNQSLAFSTIVKVNCFQIPGNSVYGLIDEFGLILIGTGLIIKIWATMIVGLDTYYYKDMFLGKSNGSFAISGPYKFLNNPMYGIGNLQLYGLALFYFSFSGLIAAIIYHLSIYGFYILIERPAVIRLYGLSLEKPVCRYNGFRYRSN